MSPLFPRPIRRHRLIRCFTDCEARFTDDPADCRCAERDEEEYERACDQRMDEWKETA